MMASSVPARKHPRLVLAAAGSWTWFLGNRRRMATVAVSALAISLGYHVVFGQNGLTAYSQKRQNSATLDRELRSLTRENNLLKQHVEHLQNDPSAIEHQARESLHYARPGEVIITLPVTTAKP